MTVRQLVAALSRMNPDRLVVLQKDAEGNGYSPLRDHGTDANCRYIAESTWSGEVRIERLTPALRAQGFGPEDCAGGDGRALRRARAGELMGKRSRKEAPTLFPATPVAYEDDPLYWPCAHCGVLLVVADPDPTPRCADGCGQPPQSTAPLHPPLPTR
jgi:hypothetical protein